MGLLYKISALVMIAGLVSCNHYHCTTDTDCPKYNVCDTSEHGCKHKDLFPTSLNEIIGLFLIVIGSALSNAGGIGGGGLLIPILLILLGFVAHEAIPISKLMIFTGALTSFLLGFRQKHPTRNAITIDYNIPLVLVPMLLFGTMVGVTLNKVFPPWFILINLTIILLMNTYKTFSKGIKLYKKEKEDLKKSQKRGAIELKDKSKIGQEHEHEHDHEHRKYRRLDDMPETSDVNKSVVSTDKDGRTSTETSQSGELKTSLDLELEKDSRKLPLEKLLIMIVCYILMLVVTFLKGSEHVKSFIGVEACGLAYWLIYFSYFPIAVGVTAYVSRNIKREYEYRRSIHFPFTENDLSWDTKTFIKLPIYSFISGCMAGLLGIGGGLIVGPLLLQLNIHPVVSTATSNFLVLFTSSSTSIQFIIMGMMNLEYGIACTIFSSIGSFFGTILIQRIIEKYKRFSFLVLVLASVLGVSTLMIPSHTLMNIVTDIQNGKDIWTFNTPC